MNCTSLRRNAPPLPLTLMTCGVILVATSRNACGVLEIPSVGVYDEQFTNSGNNLLNEVDFEAASSNISLATFKQLVAAAYQANCGGVIDFEYLYGADAPGNLLRPFIGADQSEVLQATRTDGGFFAPNFNNNTVISGHGYLGLSNGANYTIEFDRPLEAFALTALSRSATSPTPSGERSGVMTITLDDESTFVFANELILAGAGIDDTFFGYRAPANRSILAVSWVSDGGPSYFVRWDDLGFVVDHRGDYNRDGVVDAADYTTWRDAVDTPVPAADGNLDGRVDANDYTLWIQSYGKYYDGVVLQTPIVPETHSQSLLTSCLVVIVGAPGYIRAKRATD